MFTQRGENKDEMSKLIQQLVELVKQTAPELWRIAVLQVKANGVTMGIWSLISLGIGIPCLFVAIKEFKRPLENHIDDHMKAWLLLIFAGIMPIGIGLGLLTSVTQMMINPEYYAIQVLIQLVK